MTAIELHNEKELQVVEQVLSIMRADWDHQEIKIESDLREARRFGECFAFGVRDMGVTLTLRGWCDRPRDSQSGEAS